MGEKNQTSEDVQVQHKLKHNFGESKVFFNKMLLTSFQKCYIF